MTAFTTLGLSENVARGVRTSGYTTPTPIQAQAIPIVLSGKDLTGFAQTGTGKTAAFVLPLLHRLSDGPRPKGRRPVRALVVAPTRELALQVDASVRTYGAHTGLRSIAVFGGVGMEPQIRAFRNGVDIVIATPGRLLDHMNRRTLDLSSVEILVLDEADRMFDMGFINDIRKIVSATPDDRQTLLFSATMPKEIRALAEGIQRNPELVEIGERRNPAATVTQHLYSVTQENKIDLLLHLLNTEETGSVLIFTRTKHRADKVARKLNTSKFKAEAIHSGKTQNQRQRILEGFRRGRSRVLVATDIAARGIDVDGISHVINFDMPNTVEDYIHRIGRTGRAETTGDAMTFVAYEDVQAVRSIERHAGKELLRQDVPGLTTEFPKRQRSAGSNGPRNSRSGAPRGNGGGKSASGRPGGRNKKRRPASAGSSTGGNKRPGRRKSFGHSE